MFEKTPVTKKKDYCIRGPIITQQQYSPEIIKNYQNRLLTCFSEEVCEITPEDREKFYFEWEKQLQEVSPRKPKTFRLGIAIQHTNTLINPHPFLEINHNPIEFISSLFDFSEFYRKSTQILTSNQP